MKDETKDLSRLERVGFAIFASVVASFQTPFIVLAVALLPSCAIVFVGIPLCWLMNWHLPDSAEFWEAFWRGIGWLLMSASLIAGINAAICVFRGKDNWLFALSLTQDRIGEIK